MGAIQLIGPARASANITPIGMWPFNQGKSTVAYDYSGHHNDGTLEGLAKRATSGTACSSAAPSRSCTAPAWWLR